jgi:hypothetical protein
VVVSTYVSYSGESHQLPVYADDVNLLGHDIDITKKNTQTLIDASKEVGLEVNTEKDQAASGWTILKWILER